MGLGLLLGILVIALGASIVLHTLFDVDVPLFRTALGLTLLYLGARVLYGAWGPERSAALRTEAILSEARFSPPDTEALSSKYTVVFGRGHVDLTRLPPLDRDRTVQVDVVFGEAIVEIDPAMPIELVGNAAFGEVRAPDGGRAHLGEVVYRTSLPPGAPRLRVDVNAVFGSAIVRASAARAEHDPLLAVAR